MRHREAFLAIHLIALLAIAAAVLVMALRDGQAAQIWLAAATGFVLGIAFDRLVLVPLTDFITSRLRIA